MTFTFLGFPQSTPGDRQWKGDGTCRGIAWGYGRWRIAPGQKLRAIALLTSGVGQPRAPWAALVLTSGEEDRDDDPHRGTARACMACPVLRAGPARRPGDRGRSGSGSAARGGQP